MASRRVRRISSFNTQPPEGGWFPPIKQICDGFGFNTQPPEGGWGVITVGWELLKAFQHTAARRRLVNDDAVLVLAIDVSTHSRPKAAGPALCRKLS